MKLRYLFLLPELVLLFFFVFPIFKRICNPGNLAGILVCLFLLFVTLFPQVFASGSVTCGDTWAERSDCLRCAC